MADISLIQDTQPFFGMPTMAASRPGTLIQVLPAFTMHPEHGGGSLRLYLMRGWRPHHLPSPDWETWVAQGAPGGSNPSGEPIEDVTIQTTWSASV